MTMLLSLIAYTNFTNITLIWVGASAIGLALATWHIWKSWGDLQAGRKGGNPAQLNVVVDSLVSEAMRWLVHALFVTLGLFSMFIDPADLLVHKTWRDILTWSFILLPAWIATQSAFAIFMRKRLERIVSNQ